MRRFKYLRKPPEESIDSSFRPKRQTLIAQSTSLPEIPPQEFNLDLKSGWFAKSPPAFPPSSINRLPGKRSYASTSGWSSSGSRKIHQFTGAIRDDDTLATTIIHLTWDGSNPDYTVKSEQRHLLPPRKLSRDELEAYREKYGLLDSSIFFADMIRYSDAVANWSESKLDQQVGDGECWTLANNALVAVGSQLSSRGQEPCMPSQSYVHGALIYSFLPAKSLRPDPRGSISGAGVTRGDIVQLCEAHFVAKDGMSEKCAGAPDHTAVIVGVESQGVIKVVEQNVGGVKRVRAGSYDMSELVKGEVRIFRVVGESWVGKLEPRW